MSNLDPLDLSKLTVVPGFSPYSAGPNFRAVTTANGSNRMLPEAAADAIAMGKAFKRDRKTDLEYAEAYRPDEVQQWRVDEHTNGGPLAAAVGHSNHRNGTTVDYRNGIGYGPGNENYDWMHEHAGEFGFVEDVAGEHWHWHHPSTSTISGASSGATPIEEEDDMYTEADRKRDEQTSRDAAAARANSHQGNERTGKVLTELRAHVETMADFPRKVWSFVLANHYSASRNLRDIFTARKK